MYLQNVINLTINTRSNGSKVRTAGYTPVLITLEVTIRVPVYLVTGHYHYHKNDTLVEVWLVWLKSCYSQGLGIGYTARTTLSCQPMTYTPP